MRLVKYKVPKAIFAEQINSFYNLHQISRGIDNYLGLLTNQTITGALRSIGQTKRQVTRSLREVS